MNGNKLILEYHPRRRAVVAEKHLLLRESGAFHEEIVHEPLFLPRKALKRRNTALW